jgi:hypothetical protein
MSYGLLGAHVNATVGGLPEAIAQWKPPLVVILDHSDVWHGVKAESPQTVFVGRIVRDDEPNFNDPDLDPIQAARDHCHRILPWAERMGDTYRFWQGVNEPIISSPEAMRRCADFDAERARIMDGHGFRVVVGSFSVGNPQLSYWDGFVPALEAARQYGGALALHEYAWPTLDQDWPWYLLRHRKVYDGEPAHNWDGLPDHLKALPLLITECGLDGLIEQSDPPRGWQVLYAPDQYLQQLAWYDSELQKDTYVAGAAIYCCGVSDWMWSSYNIWPEPAGILTQEAIPIYRLEGPQPPEPPVEPPEPPEVPETDWQMEIEYRPGARIIAGSLPEPGIELTVVDPWGNASTTISGAKPEFGPGGFEVLAPNEAAYTLTFLDQSFEIQTHDGTTFVTFSRSELPPEPPIQPEPPEPEVPETDWRMEIEYRPGARIIAGSLPEPGVELAVVDPWGNASTTVSGAKPEFGPGGFEVLAPNVAAHTLTFLDQSFEIQTHDGATFVTFTRGTLPPSPSAPHSGVVTAQPPLQTESLGFLARLSQLARRLRQRLFGQDL